MMKRLIILLMFVGAMALLSTGISLAQEKTSSAPSHKHGSKASLPQVPGLTTHTSKRTTSDTKSAKSGAAAPATSTVYGPFIRNFWDGTTDYHGYPSLIYGYIYPQPSYTTEYADFWLYNSSSGNWDYQGAQSMSLFTDSDNSYAYYDTVWKPSQSGYWKIMIDNCVDPQNPSGCDYSVVYRTVY
jgi:hypothetical protein